MAQRRGAGRLSLLLWVAATGDADRAVPLTTGYKKKKKKKYRSSQATTEIPDELMRNIVLATLYTLFLEFEEGDATLYTHTRNEWKRPYYHLPSDRQKVGEEEDRPQKWRLERIQFQTKSWARLRRRARDLESPVVRARQRTYSIGGIPG